MQQKRKFAKKRNTFCIRAQFLDTQSSLPYFLKIVLLSMKDKNEVAVPELKKIVSWF